MKLLRFLFAVAFVVAAAADPAIAQFAPAPAGTTIDLAPVVNQMIQGLAVLIPTMLLPLAWAGFGLLMKKWKLEGLKIEEQYRKAIDDGAQKAIGGALASLNVQPGKLTIDVKNKVIAEAGNKLIANFPDAMADLKVEDIAKKASEIIESRIGLMQAAAEGAPVPNPSQPPQVVTAPAAPAAT